MGIEWSLVYFMLFLQVLAGVVLLKLKLEPRLPVRIFGVLFLFNAGAAAIMGLPREAAIWLASDPGLLTRGFRALDAPTGYLLLAFLAARSARAWARPAAFALLSLGLILALLEFPLHRQMVETEHILRAIPLYVGLGAGAYILARGSGWERWIGLALAARGLYWGSAGVLAVAEFGLGDVAHLFVNRIGLLVLAILCVAAAVRFVTGEGRLPTSVVIPVLLIGPAAAILETGVARALPPEDHFRYGSVVIVNLLTLALVRPVLTLMGLARASLYPVVTRATLATGVAVLSTLFLPSFRGTPLEGAAGEAVTYGLGICIGLLTLAALEAVPALHLRVSGGHEPLPPALPEPPSAPLAALAVAPEPVVAIRASAEPRGRSPGSGPPARPQWQTILLALKGSCPPPGVSLAPEPRLTQRALAEGSGIRVSRVSTLTRELNEQAEARLDAHVPGWRSMHPSGLAPEIVRHLRGAVTGAPGVWVYYRLTPLGERLAAAVEAEFPQNSPPT